MNDETTTVNDHREPHEDAVSAVAGDAASARRLTSRRIRAAGAGLLLVLVGVAVVRTILGGQLTSYVKPVMTLPLLATAAILAYVGYRRWEAAALGLETGDTGDSHGDGHQTHIPWVAWLLVVPVVALLGSPPPALSADAAIRQGPTQPSAQQAAIFPPLPAGDPVPLSTREAIERAVYEPESGIYDREVSIDGFAVPQEDGSWSLARMGLQCCAADAVAWSIPVDAAAAAPAEGEWVRLTGRLRPGSPAPSGDFVLPEIVAETVEPISEPADPYV